ncbi:hypothetical protein SDC9_32479 [bioreactor metagenome]|uniref:Uncharacterized protein n=1 Tax=bioreactor metagenome TaxID=1076179 RepID=A0A644V5K8_9ZZZZ
MRRIGTAAKEETNWPMFKEAPQKWREQTGRYNVRQAVYAGKRAEKK